MAETNESNKSKYSKVTPTVIKEGDTTADHVIRAHIKYVPGAESVQIQVYEWNEIKAYHIMSVEVDADEINKVFTTFMKNLCSNCRPTYRYMETAESYRTKKEGRASANAYNGATGVTLTDQINYYSEQIEMAYANGLPAEIISQLAAKRQELIDKEVEEINALKNSQK
jgi:hypothetical protein